jgi:hypothetical protein
VGRSIRKGNLMGTYNLQLHHDDDCRDYWENPANKKVRYLFDLIQISRKTSGAKFRDEREDVLR